MTGKDWILAGLFIICILGLIGGIVGITLGIWEDRRPRIKRNSTKG